MASMMEVMQGARNDVLALQDKVKVAKKLEQAAKAELKQSEDENKKLQSELDSSKAQTAQAINRSDNGMKRVAELEEQLTNMRKVNEVLQVEVAKEKLERMELCKGFTVKFNELTAQRNGMVAMLKACPSEGSASEANTQSDCKISRTPSKSPPGLSNSANLSSGSIQKSSDDIMQDESASPFIKKKINFTEYDGCDVQTIHSLLADMNTANCHLYEFFESTNFKDAHSACYQECLTLGDGKELGEFQQPFADWYLQATLVSQWAKQQPIEESHPTSPIASNEPFEKDGSTMSQSHHVHSGNEHVADEEGDDCRDNDMAA